MDNYIAVLLRRMDVFRNHKADQYHDGKGHDEEDNEPVARFGGHAGSRGEPKLNRAATKSQFVTFHHAAI